MRGSTKWAGRYLRRNYFSVGGNAGGWSADRNRGFGLELARGLIQRFDGEIFMCSVTEESVSMFEKLPDSEFIEC